MGSCDIFPLLVAARVHQSSFCKFIGLLRLTGTRQMPGPAKIGSRRFGRSKLDPSRSHHNARKHWTKLVVA